MTLVEREDALGALRAAASSAHGGAGQMVLVAGEAGAGKSALVEALEAEIGRDVTWLVGACDGQFTPLPLGPLVDVARALGGPLAERCASRAPRAELFEGLLEALDGPSLAVLVVEDAQWADDATLDLLRFLGRRIRTLRCLVIVTYRDDALTADAAWRQAVGELSRQRTVRRIDVSPLSLDAVARLAGPSGLDAAELHRLTGGNAFFLTELLAAGSIGLPRTARDAVLAKAARVSASARDALDVAALLGGRLTPALMTKAGLDGVDVDELVGAGLLVGDGDAVRFRHELARCAIDAELIAHRRVEVHGRVLDALEAVGCDNDARLAFHADGVGRSASVLVFAPRAARAAAALGAHREAAAQYRRALRHVDPADERQLAVLHDELSTELACLDRWDEAADARIAGLALWRVLDEPRRVGEALRQLGSVMWRLCRGEENVRFTQQAVEVLEPLGTTPELAWAYAYRSIDAPDLTTMAADIDRARRLAGTFDLQDLLGMLLVAEAEHEFRAGGQWETLLHDAQHLAAQLRLDLLAGSVFATLHELLVSSFRLADGHTVYATGVAFCDDRELAVYGSCLRGRHALALTEEARWDEALAVADVVLASTASPVNLLTSRVASALARMRRGDPRRDIDATLVPALDSAGTLGETPWVVMTSLARAEQHWLLGDETAARTEVARARGALRPMFVAESMEVARWERRLRRARVELEPAAFWDERRCPYRAALALVDEGGVPALREALGRLEALGASATADLVRRRLRERGERAVAAGRRPETRRHPLGLTVRQQEVLEMLADGLTNDQIGARLFISAKTVDHHVSALLAKLGVRNRREAARVALDRALVRS